MVGGMKTAIPVLLLFMLMPLEARKHRGVWFWKSTGNPYGSAAIVGVSALENQTIAFFSAQSIRRVYGSYGTRSISEPAVIAAWNTKLHAAGMQSQFLLSETSWILPDNRPNLLNAISTRILDFNNTPGRTEVEKFDGIHLDLEPQAMGATWDGATPLEKRGFLIDLKNTYAEVRAHLVAAEVPDFPVYADLPVWFDNLGSIGWTDAADRDLWFTEIAVSLTGISLMPFDRSSFSSINNGVSWERANISGADVRVGLEADIGSTGTWSYVPDFNAMMETMESAYGSSGAVDIQSYRQWREALAALPLVAVSAVIEPVALALEGDVVFPGQSGWTHVILQSAGLCSWQEILRVKAVETAPITHRVGFDGARGFWKVQRFEEEDP